MSADAALLETRGRLPGPARSLRRSALSALCLCVLIAVVAPVAWILLLALKSNSETVSGGILPNSPQWGNFITAWRQYGLAGFFVNSLVVTVTSVIGTLLGALMAAYAFTRVSFRGSELLFSCLLLGVIIPPAALVVPLLIEVRQFGLYNTHVGLSLAYVALGLPIATLILRGFMQGIPHEIIEAARLDGCGELRILRSIVVPLSKSAIATVAVLLFLANWNEFILALVLLRDNTTFTLPVGIAAQIGQYTTQYNLVAAASLIACLPTFILYVALQRHFERGITEGALKG